MNVLENIRNALGAIGSNKLRSALTMLGIIIGVSSVVLMIAIGQGAQRGVTSRLQSLGTNLLTITPGSPNRTNVRSGGGGGGGGGSTLTADDVAAIRASVTGLSGVSPELSTRLQAIAGPLNMNTSVQGATPDYLVVRNASVAFGDFLTPENVERMDKVAVLGSQAAATLFPGDADLIGKDVRIQNSIFTVVGVMQSKGQQGLQNLDDTIFIPLSTLQLRVAGQPTLGSIGVSVADASRMAEKQAEITAALLASRAIADASAQDFTVLNQADAVETLNEVTGIFTLLLGGIAAISLLVGGIGVMNIMLVSVTERTREIGIRKAIGAKKRDIILQFLVESTVLSLLGGVIGILISVAGSMLVKRYGGIDASVTLSPVLLAFLFSIGIGIFFGLLPAWKAAKLRPIEALRYE